MATDYEDELYSLRMSLVRLAQVMGLENGVMLKDGKPLLEEDLHDAVRRPRGWNLLVSEMIDKVVQVDPEARARHYRTRG